MPPMTAQPKPAMPTIAAPSVETRPPVVPHVIAELPPVALTLPPDSGLELVETRHRAEPPVETAPQPTGPRRVRPPRVVIADEPLEIVETRKGAPPPA
jgi:hypothetical protein